MRPDIFMLLFAAQALLLFADPFHVEKDWKDLLDSDLSQWETYLSYRHKPGYAGEAPRDKDGNLIEPIGYNKNVSNVFTTLEIDGDLALRVSGEIYGCVFTRQEFENYHLKLKVKWGDKKWEPRLDEPKDSGILYHSQGECGVDYWRAWMLSQEMQIIENGMGDYWCIANSQIDIRSEIPQGKTHFVYKKEGEPVSFGTGAQGFCQVNEFNEKPSGEWNTLELITYGDKSLHIVNGKVVMALANSRYGDGEKTFPLTKGKIQLQSEAAEVFFKDIKIKNINSLPRKYSSYF